MLLNFFKNSWTQTAPEIISATSSRTLLSFQKTHPKYCPYLNESRNSSLSLNNSFFMFYNFNVSDVNKVSTP